MSSIKLQAIVPPIIVFGVVIAVLIAGRFYEHLPIKPPSCGFKKITGQPCVSCRGTRSIRSLAQGKFVAAVNYNPLAIFGCAFSIFWLAGYVIRKGDPPRRRLTTKQIAWITTSLVIVNWIYLIFTEHWYS